MSDKSDNSNNLEPVEFYQEKNVLGLDIPKLEEMDDNDNSQTIPDPFENIEYPSLLQRIQALFIDVVIIMAVFYCTSLLIDYFGGGPNWLRATIFIFMIYLYEPVLISFWGGTIGHKTLQLRVRSVKDPDKNLMFILALFRSFLKWFFGWLSFITITFNKRRRAIHDLGSGSIIILSVRK